MSPDSTTNPIHQLFNQAGLRKFLRRTRVPLALVAAGWLAFNVKPEWFWPGLAVSAVGEFFQLWCFAALHKEQSLATNGPYKVVRNPMYLARFLILFGCLMFLGNWVVLALCPILYYFYMVNRVRREEVRLQQILGEPYAEYCRKVSRFVPFCGISSHGHILYFKWPYFLENNGHTNGLAQCAYYAVCYVITFKPFAS
jgi:protein-S-isoprenylcysteine O-methyltransferase Ste14